MREKGVQLIKHGIQITAPVGVCFGLAENVKLFILAMPKLIQRPVAGVMKGLRACLCDEQAKRRKSSLFLTGAVFLFLHYSVLSLATSLKDVK